MLCSAVSDLQFPIDVSGVQKDHPFLEPDSLQSLFRRLHTLNRCANMKVDTVKSTVSTRPRSSTNIIICYNRPTTNTYIVKKICITNTYIRSAVKNKRPFRGGFAKCPGQSQTFILVLQYCNSSV